MKKRGFTLIELLAVIVVLAAIGTIVSTLVVKYIDSTRQNSLKIQKTEIIKAAKDWSLKNTDKFDKYHLNDTYISIETLKKDNFLENKKVKDPTTGKEMVGCVVAKYQKSSKSYNFEFNNTDCEELKSQNPTKEPAISYILNNESVKENSSLVEENNYYVYKGINPDNYIQIDNKIWRIISIDKETMNLKIVLTSYSIQKEWNNSIESSIDLSFMNSSLINDINNSNVMTDTISTYLVSNSTWYMGDILDSSDHSFTSVKSIERQNSLNLDIGLLTATEYIEASNDSNCLKEYVNNCSNDNYLNFNNNYWLLNSSSNSLSKIENGNITKEINNLNILYVYPVVYLNYGVQLKGSGTSSNPYTIY